MGDFKGKPLLDEAGNVVGRIWDEITPWPPAGMSQEQIDTRLTELRNRPYSPMRSGKTFAMAEQIALSRDKKQIYVGRHGGHLDRLVSRVVDLTGKPALKEPEPPADPLWGESVLERCLKPLQNYMTAHDVARPFWRFPAAEPQQPPVTVDSIKKLLADLPEPPKPSLDVVEHAKRMMERAAGMDLDLSEGLALKLAEEAQAWRRDMMTFKLQLEIEPAFEPYTVPTFAATAGLVIKQPRAIVYNAEWQHITFDKAQRKLRYLLRTAKERGYISPRLARRIRKARAKHV